MFSNTLEVYDWLYNQKKLTKRDNLNRIANCIKLLNIKTNYKIVHIAGTNGKGSTAIMLKNILQSKFKNVGLFVSPFVVSFNERIELNNRYITDDEIIKYANNLYDFANLYYKEYNDVIPFFELTFLMALQFFNDQNVDVAVIECGLGGLLDATNVLNTDLAIITSIGYDHMQQLGNSLEEIANHKLGIAKKDEKLICCVDKALFNQFKLHSEKYNNNVVFINDDVSDIFIDNYTNFKYKNINYKTSLIGIFQAYNASLAIEASLYIDSSITTEEIEKSLLNSFNPGRLEKIKDNVFIDGAHNIHGIKALVLTAKDLFKNKKIKIVFSALHDKAYKEMLEELDKITYYYYFTTIVDKRASQANDFTLCTKRESIVIDDYKECINQALKDLKDDEVLLITGSLHFISYVRNFLKK